MGVEILSRLLIMESGLSSSLLAGIGVELYLAIGLIFFILGKGNFPRCLRSKKLPFPVCTNAACKELEELMLNYMEKELAFHSTENELDAVMQKLEEQKEHHTEGLSEKEGRRSLMQCLRTTLVNHPDDLRGRRRANKAREILINRVYDDGGCLFRLEEKFNRLGNQLADTFLSDSTKRKARAMVLQLEILFTLVWSAAVWVLDVYSDVSVIYAIWVAIRTISDIKESDNTHWIILQKCNITHTEDLNNGLDILSGIFWHYFQAMCVICVLATLIQIVKSLSSS